MLEKSETLSRIFHKRADFPPACIGIPKSFKVNYEYRRDFPDVDFFISAYFHFAVVAVPFFAFAKVFFF